MKIYNNIGFLINRTGLLLKLKMQRVFTENDYQLTAEHWGVLQCLYETDGLSQVELSEILGKDKPNITRILDVMEKNNLIVRKSDPDDRRKYIIFLTKRAKEIKNDLFKLAKNTRERILKGFSDSEVEIFVKMINKIYKNIV